VSGDVTAAIERLQRAHEFVGGNCSCGLAWHLCPIASDLDALLAEVERLRAEPDNEAVSRTVQMLREENARLRVERDLLVNMVQASDAEREALVAARGQHPTCDVHDEDGPITCGWKSAVRDMDRVLSPGSEASQ